jgi:hypothetical protein
MERLTSKNPIHFFLLIHNHRRKTLSLFKTVINFMEVLKYFGDFDPDVRVLTLTTKPFHRVMSISVLLGASEAKVCKA